MGALPDWERNLQPNSRAPIVRVRSERPFPEEPAEPIGMGRFGIVTDEWLAVAS